MSVGFSSLLDSITLFKGDSARFHELRSSSLSLSRSSTPSPLPQPTDVTKYGRSSIIAPCATDGKDDFTLFILYDFLFNSKDEIKKPLFEPEIISMGHSHEDLRMLYNKCGPDIVNMVGEDGEFIFPLWWVLKYIIPRFEGGGKRRVWPHWIREDNEMESVEKEGDYAGVRFKFTKRLIGEFKEMLSEGNADEKDETNEVSPSEDGEGLDEDEEDATK
ncbi:hypothetical protein RUND412_005803 [Rhizina undulata]